jgi:hypothetical protein
MIPPSGGDVAAKNRSRPSRRLGAACLLTLQWLVAPAATLAEGTSAETGPESSFDATAYYYAMRDQSDFASAVVAYNRDALHLEARYNYEERDAASAFIGWNFAGGGDLSYEVTPIVGLLFGSTHGVIPGVEASVAYGAFDASIEAEYVENTDEHGASYFYTWDELGWTPLHWLRVGLAGQRTRAIESSRELERGLFAQVMASKVHFGVYVFNPDLSSRYVVAAFGVSF